jgi:nitrogenase molybdenum-iron protein beta chain
MASSSSFTEGASVFGGGANLKQSVKNIFDVYDPDVIAVHTTCLSETIGDDLNSFIQELDLPDGKIVVHCNTPSYVGSHVTGFGQMVAGFIRYLAQKDAPKIDKIGLFPGFVNPGDIRELKRLLALMNVTAIILPDPSFALDGPMTGTYKMFPPGGTPIADIVALGGVKKVLALGLLASKEPALTIKSRCGVETELLPLPMGVAGTDAFLLKLKELSSQPVPPELELERGRLIDLLLDSHQYFYQKKVAIFGDPDTVVGLVAMALEMGLTPKYVATGTPGEAFVVEAKALFAAHHEPLDGVRIKAGADLFELHQWIKNEPVDLLIGTSYGKQIAKAEDVPMVRAGFPILDRYGHAYHPLIGYPGTRRLAELALGALMDRYDRDCADEDLDVVM